MAITIFILSVLLFVAIVVASRLAMNASWLREKLMAKEARIANLASDRDNADKSCAVNARKLADADGHISELNSRIATLQIELAEAKKAATPVGAAKKRRR